MLRSTSRTGAPRGDRGTIETAPGDRVTVRVTVLRGVNRHPQVRGITRFFAKGDGVTVTFEIRLTCARARHTAHGMWFVRGACRHSHMCERVDVSPRHPHLITQSYHILTGDTLGVLEVSPLSVTRHPSLHTFGNTREETDE